MTQKTSPHLDPSPSSRGFPSQSAVSFSLFILFLLSATCLDVQLSYLNRIDPSPSRQADTAIVLGASVDTSGHVSDALRDRLLTAIDLYQSRRVKNILVTGDNGAFHTNEVAAMQDFLLAHHVPPADILLDGQGYRTYESCKRAKDIFHLQTALIVTQRFHLARALFLCNHLGIDSYGINADRMHYLKEIQFWLRDLAASVKAWSDIYLITPRPPV